MMRYILGERRIAPMKKPIAKPAKSASKKPVAKSAAKKPAAKKTTT